LFGWNLESEFALGVPLPYASGPPDLIVREALAGDVHPALELLHESAVRDPRGVPRLALLGLGDKVIFRLGAELEFLLDESSVEYRLLDPAARWAIEPVLLTTVAALVLERSGVVALHGSAVRWSGRTMAFLAHSTGGKSTLAASLVAAGAELVSDDVLALDDRAATVSVRPSYPLVKLTPESAALFGPREFPPLPEFFPGQSKRAVVVGRGGVGRFAGESSPLSALYLLDRRVAVEKVAIEPVSPRDAVVHLIRQSYAPRLVEALGLAPRRLDFLARLAGGVPTRRLVYPSGLDRLPEVHAALAADRGEPVP
jgi:hypothetical protein